MAAITPSGMPGTTMVEGRARNGKGSSEPSMAKGLESFARAITQGLGQEHHGRNADAAADQQRARSFADVA